MGSSRTTIHPVSGAVKQVKCESAGVFIGRVFKHLQPDAGPVGQR
jgi:hypothetical protein